MYQTNNKNIIVKLNKYYSHVILITDKTSVEETIT